MPTNRNPIHQKGLIRVDGTQTDFKDLLEGVDPGAYKNLEMFGGVAASTATTMNLFAHSDRAIQQLADAYIRGKGIYTDHNIELRNRVGKTINARVADGKLEVAFGIKPGIEVNNSDDIISIIRDTGSDLSASYYPGSMSCGVDGCGKELMANGFWFMSWYECADGHCVGDLLEDTNERITGIIDTIDDVVELSLVSVGANLDAEVTGEISDQLTDKVGTDLTFLRFLSESNGYNFDNTCLKFGIDSRKPHHKPNRDKQPKGGTPVATIIKDYSNPDWSAIENADNDDLLEIVKEFATHAKAQNDTMAEMKPVDEYETLATELTAVKTELDQANATIAEYAKQDAVYQAEVVYWQDACIDEKQKLRSYSDNDPRLLAYAEDVRRITDITVLRNQTVKHSDTITAVGSVKTFMELKSQPSDQPEVPSDY